MKAFAFLAALGTVAATCPCSTCPCPKNLLPRTCDKGSVSSNLSFCDISKPVEARVADLVTRLTREEKINLVTQADTGFLPRLNLKEFNFFNTCHHGWWTSNVTTFGMPIGFAATFDNKLMRRIADVIGVESRALSQRDYIKSFDSSTGYHGVALDWLVCKDSAEVNMNRHPLWGR
jgi:beta-glucosidase